jgi:hypothetical protein
VRIGLSSIRQNDITGAPIRSEPKLGNACACRPSRNAASASSSAALTTPWPPRPWNRTWNIVRVLPVISDLCRVLRPASQWERGPEVVFVALWFASGN